MLNTSEKILSLEKNIISWYPFEDKSKILCINVVSKEIIKVLKKATNIVDQIDGVDEESKIQDKKYDYVFLYGINKETFKLEEYLKFIQSHLTENGTILIVGNNKYGLESYNVDVKTDKEEHFYSKKEIEEELKKNNMIKYKFYYPLPNYKTPNVIFTDEYLPDQESILRDLTLYNESEICVLDERKKYIEIIEEEKEFFTLFANSFFIEISNKDNGIKFISFNNSRKEKYRINTIMREDIVYKEINNQEAKKHFKQIKNNIDILNKLGFNVLDEFKEDKVYSKIMPKEEQLDKVLIGMYANNDKEKAIELIRKFLKEITDKLLREPQDGTDIFKKYDIEISEEMKEKLHYSKYGLYDLIFQNCFYKDNRFYFYDQEWFEENIPVEFIIYRTIEYLGNSSSKIDKELLFDEFKIKEFISKFNELEKELQKEIKDEIIWDIHAKNRTTIKNLYDTQVHYNNLYTLSKDENIQLKKYTEELEKEKIRLNNELSSIKDSRSWKLIESLKKFKKTIKLK